MIKNFSVLIVDDEPLQRELIATYFFKAKLNVIVFKASTGQDAINVLEKNKIDLVFLDIEIPSPNGLEIAKLYVNKLDIIFTTAYSEFAVEAFNLSAIDYLLKPVTFERFQVAFDKFFNKKKQQIKEESIILINSLTKQDRFIIDDILYIEAQRNKTLFYLKDSTTRGVNSSFYMILSQLPKEHFVQIHKSFAVNRIAITRIESKSIVIGDKIIPVGRVYKKNIDSL